MKDKNRPPYVSANFLASNGLSDWRQTSPPNDEGSLLVCGQLHLEHGGIAELNSEPPHQKVQLPSHPGFRLERTCSTPGVSSSPVGAKTLQMLETILRVENVLSEGELGA